MPGWIDSESFALSAASLPGVALNFILLGTVVAVALIKLLCKDVEPVYFCSYG